MTFVQFLWISENGFFKYFKAFKFIFFSKSFLNKIISNSIELFFCNNFHIQKGTNKSILAFEYGGNVLSNTFLIITFSFLSFLSTSIRCLRSFVGITVMNEKRHEQKVINSLGHVALHHLWVTWRFLFLFFLFRFAIQREPKAAENER